MPRSLLIFFLLTIGIPILFKIWLENVDVFEVASQSKRTGDSEPSEVQVFSIDVDEDRILSLKSKLATTRLPEKTSDFWKNLTKVMSDYDWKQHERFLNTFKQYKVVIDGQEIHFLRISIAPPKGAQIVPIVLLHGFPGTYWDFFKVIPILSNPRRFNYDFGVKHALLFDVIVPSLPGFIFSEKNRDPHFSAADSARLLVRLMETLALEKYFIHGTEKIGADIATTMAAIDPNVWGMHLSNPFVPPSFSLKTTLKYMLPGEGTSLWDFYSQPQFRPTENSDFVATAVHDSPIGQCALIMQYWDIGSSASKQLNELFTLDELATVCHLYWLTDSLPSALTVMNNLERSEDRYQVRCPVAVLKTADAPWETADSILRHQYLNITRITRLEKGGLYNSLQISEELAADIFRFVELTIL